MLLAPGPVGCTVMLWPALFVLSGLCGPAGESPRTSPWWDLPQPDPLSPAAGLPVPQGVRHTTVFRADPSWGMYNHGPQLAVTPSGGMAVSWYSGECCEDAPGERVLYSLRPRHGEWGGPGVLFERIGPTLPNGRDGILVTNYPFLSRNGRVYAIAQCALCTLCGCPPPSHHEPLCFGRAIVNKTQGRRLAPYLMRQINADDTLGRIFWMTTNPEDLVALGRADVLQYNASLLTAADRQTQDDARFWISTRTNEATPQDSQTIAAHLNERSAYARPARAGRQPAMEMLIRDGIHTCPPGGPRCGALAAGARVACPADALGGCGTFMWTSTCLQTIIENISGAPQCRQWSMPQPSAIPGEEPSLTSLL